MAARPGVKTASAPVVAIDTVVLAQQMVGALARVPFRRPLRGRSIPVSNFGEALTREVIRSFMGYVSSLPVPEFRSIEYLLDELCKVFMPPVVRSFDVSQRSIDLGGVPGIFYEPRRSEPEGAILYLHGGGFIGTSPTMYAYFTAYLCRETRCAVFVADYRLAPEFPFPAGLDDAAQVLAALLELGVPQQRLFVAGDSAGGGLAVDVVQAATEDSQSVKPAGLILFSPEVDMTLDEPSVTENAARDILPWNIPTSSYLHGLDARSRWASAVDADLTGFPPTYLSWGGYEMFRDPIRRFAERLQRAGVSAHAHEAPGMFHVFQIVMPWAEASAEARSHVVHFVRSVIDEAPPIEANFLAGVGETSRIPAGASLHVDSRAFGGDHRAGSSSFSGTKGGTPMATEHDELQAAVAELTHSMSRFVRALDAVGDSEAASHLSPDFVSNLGRLTARLDAIEGIGG
jgi:epsilon-lactone hydrolase